MESKYWFLFFFDMFVYGNEFQHLEIEFKLKN
jgi:hypothetical protein